MLSFLFINMRFLVSFYLCEKTKNIPLIESLYKVNQIGREVSV